MIANSTRIYITSLGIFSMLIGGAIYIFIRDPQTLYLANYLLLPNQFSQSLTNSFPGWAHVLTNSLPTGVHAFSFSLFTALMLGINGIRIAASCVTWAIFDCFFEFLQILRPAFCNTLSLDNDYCDLICSYITNGTFDWNDIFSILLGTLAAYTTLWYFTNLNSK